MLRIDDTDLERSTAENEQGIETDLTWLGLVWGERYNQSKRFDHYAAAAERLKAIGRLYACYETQEELDRRRKVQLSRGQPPIYDRAGLNLTDEERAALEAEGRRPHWRFKLDGKRVVWDDLVRGRCEVDTASLSDPVLIREDGTWLYTLPSVVDDIELGVSHVIRGDDHVTNTGVQIALFRALGAEPPAFGHHNLLTTASGEGLSKRTGALSIASLREQGIEPMAVASLAVLTGTAENVVAARDMAELAERFDPAATSRSAAKFDPADLLVLNRALLHQTSYDEVRQRLREFGIEGEKAEPFWLAVRGNIDRLADAGHWWKVLTDGPQPAPDLSPEDRTYVAAAIDLLPSAPWDETSFGAWIDTLKGATGRKGKALFMPLRLALTGSQSGPELADLFRLLGPEGMRARRP